MSPGLLNPLFLKVFIKRQGNYLWVGIHRHISMCPLKKHHQIHLENEPSVANPSCYTFHVRSQGLDILFPVQLVNANEFQGSILSKQCVERLSVNVSCFHALVLVIKEEHTFLSLLTGYVEGDHEQKTKIWTAGARLMMHCCIVNIKLLHALVNT